jgi:hypothetical protein
MPLAFAKTEHMCYHGDRKRASIIAVPGGDHLMVESEECRKQAPEDSRKLSAWLQGLVRKRIHHEVQRR